ncbi:hypothetical protein Micbo1qcDRAFT_33120 [Microdochium bolleyi]|uniref:Uncharacterized protein n=1 Tax=Microdochium bolleyi TaxID=196109 RepID=A0A136IPS5_9PEZI|nr:hypothetical protein Micbo1qcDRAFT_33120 [Microdochium bolleyi]
MLLPPKPSLAAAAILLAQATSAFPHLSPRQAAAAAAVPAPWVTVDASGLASTVTPSLSTTTATSGTTTTITTILNGAPAEVTGTVATVPFWDTTSFITGTPSPPKPTGDVAGAFLVCNNRDGKDAPFCTPTAGSQLFPGSRYYFTWDAKFFAPNASVTISARYYNTSSKTTGDEAFRSPKNLATRGFWAFPIDSSLLRDVLNPSETIMVQIITGKDGVAPAPAPASGSRAGDVMRRQLDSANNTMTIDGPVLTIAKPTGPVAEQHFTVPTGAALYIGLPVVGGFILLCVVGVCLWNRKHRRIEIGNVMSRARHGYGAGKSARSRLRMGKSRKFKEHIQLRERELGLHHGGLHGQGVISPTAPSPIYRDQSPPLPSPGRMRRDRDEEDLGSLAGTPVEDRRMNFDGGRADGPPTGNVFRDEMRRQKTEKF